MRTGEWYLRVDNGRYFQSSGRPFNPRTLLTQPPSYKPVQPLACNVLSFYEGGNNGSLSWNCPFNQGGCSVCSRTFCSHATSSRRMPQAEWPCLWWPSAPTTSAPCGNVHLNLLSLCHKLPPSARSFLHFFSSSRLLSVSFSLVFPLCFLFHLFSRAFALLGKE